MMARFIGARRGAFSFGCSSAAQGFDRRYSCGPTVYDRTHIGHARNYVQVDVMQRLLEGYFGRRVVHVMGITDVDDKIIAKAKERGVTPAQLAAEQEDEFFACMAKLGVRPPHMLTRVTEHVEEIVTLIEQIKGNGFAYTTRNGVYFDTRAFVAKHHDYYVLGGHAQHGEEDEDGDAGKRSKGDFALWKFRESSMEPCGWDSRLGYGRPGWHIECSAMIKSAFGDKKLTVHSGGVDLCFPHHNNEIAQTVGARGGSARDWFGHFVHVGHLHIEGRKMSKSLKNFITVDEFLARYPADAFRMFVLMHHYRAGTSFTDTKMQDAMAVLSKMRRFVEELGSGKERAQHPPSLKVDSHDLDMLEALRECEDTMLRHLENDLETNEAVHRLMEMMSQVHRYGASPSAKGNIMAQGAHMVARFLHLSGLGSGMTSNSSQRADAVAQVAVDIRGRVKDWAKDLPKELRGHGFALTDWARDELIRKGGVEVHDLPKGGYTWNWRD